MQRTNFGAAHAGIALHLALALAFILAGCSSASRQATHASPPTGRYISELLSLEVCLNPSGTYEINSQSFGPGTTERGNWTWDNEHREFSLVRTEGALQFAVRKLRVDRRDSTRLQWIPPSPRLPEVETYDGVIDYVGFRRQGEL